MQNSVSIESSYRYYLEKMKKRVNQAKTSAISVQEELKMQKIFWSLVLIGCASLHILVTAPAQDEAAHSPVVATHNHPVIPDSASSVIPDSSVNSTPALPTTSDKSVKAHSETSAPDHHVSISLAIPGSKQNAESCTIQKETFEIFFK